MPYEGEERRVCSDDERAAWRQVHLKRLGLKEVWPLIMLAATTMLTVLGTGITMRQDIALLRQDLAQFHGDFERLEGKNRDLEREITIARDRVNELNRATGILEERSRRYHPGEIDASRN